MSQPIRSRARAQEARRRPRFQIEAIRPLEERQLLAPYLSSVATEVVVTQPDTTVNIFNVALNPDDELATSAAPYVAASQLTPLASFGNNNVRIEAGPGGDFGKSVYAITRGISQGGGQVSGGRPGVIFRIDPATGDTSVFFDLNTVVGQAQPGSTAANSAGVGTGLVNWYDIAFDADGVFDGLPSMFVSSVDRNDPLKNAVYRIGTDGTFLGLYIVNVEGLDASNLQRRPSALLVPPAEQQDFLRGLFVGSGTNQGSPAPIPPAGNNPFFSALFFDANQVQGASIIDGAPLPPGVSTTRLNFGPQVGLTSANEDYAAPVYSAFTDFGEPAVQDFSSPLPGLSGLQGLNGQLLIGAGTTTLASLTPDAEGAVSTPFRRFGDVAFDQYGYFSYGTTVTPGVGGALPTLDGPPIFAGSLFVTDLASGLAAAVTPVAPLPTAPITVPIQGPGTIVLQPDPISGVVRPVLVNGNSTGGNVGGRVLRVQPDGTVTPFAEGFNTSGRQDSGAFVESGLSITFSADGTTLYVADGDGIWQFKSTLSLAHSSAGELVGLGDLRTLGVPFQGEGTAVAVVDTGIDAAVPGFRGLVARGKNIFTDGPADDDLGAGNGHGTPVAGVIAQFVPRATLLPVNVFSPLASGTTNQAFYDAIRYVADTPFVANPARRGQLDRVVAANFGFGTVTTFDTEGTAFRQNKQLVIALKNQMQRLLHRGITPIAAAGQFGDPLVPEIGNVNGEPLPAILNDVVSVTGSYPFPFRLGPTTKPTDPPSGPIGRLLPPAALAPDFATLPVITENDLTIFSDRLLSAANRSHTTDFAAPAVGVPTFRRTFVGDGLARIALEEAGTSLSSGMVSGSFALLASALEFYNTLAVSGTTVNAYLTSPVDSRSLDFGPHALRLLDAYSNPNGINAILQWTAVPVEDRDIPGDEVVDQRQPMSLGNPAFFREFSRVDVGNAVAAIEGSVALAYLFQTGTISLIDSNNNGFITAQEIENFVAKASTIGLPEAGAMARLLGGTARPPGEVEIAGPREFVTTVVADPIAPLGLTSQLEQPGEPNVYQRRFNFLDYAADGNLDGVISIKQLELLAHTLLPPPDSFVITDRQRGSAGGYLLDGTPVRNWADLQRLLPTYAFVPQQITQRFRNFTPNRFGINRGLGANDPNAGPFYALFETKPRAARPQAGRNAPATNPATTPATPPAAEQANRGAAATETPRRDNPLASGDTASGSNAANGATSTGSGLGAGTARGSTDRYLGSVASRTTAELGTLRPASSDSENDAPTGLQRGQAVDAIMEQLATGGSSRVNEAVAKLRASQG